MKVLSIGMDRKLFEEGSAVLERSILYASKMEELHIIVFSLEEHHLIAKKINNLSIYPTNSSSRIGFLWDAYILGKKIILENNFVRGLSVISSQDPFETGFVSYLLCMRFRLPLQIQIHTDFLSRYFKNSILNRIRVFIAKFLIPRAQGIRVVSEVISNSLTYKFPNLSVKPKILPIFVDVAGIVSKQPKKDIHHDFPQFKFIIFMASRLTKEKRIDIALRAMQKVISQFKYVGLIIAGDGKEKKRLEGIANSLGISENVTFIGWQNDPISYYKTANMFLLTSEYEGYGMTLIEAGSSGCPIVTTKVGIANTSAFDDGVNSYVCPVGDVESISRAIASLVSSNSKRELFKQRMQDNIRRATLPKDEYVTEYVRILKALTAENHKYIKKV